MPGPVPENVWSAVLYDCSRLPPWPPPSPSPPTPIRGHVRSPQYIRGREVFAWPIAHIILRSFATSVVAHGRLEPFLVHDGAPNVAQKSLQKILSTPSGKRMLALMITEQFAFCPIPAFTILARGAVLRHSTTSSTCLTLGRRFQEVLWTTNIYSLSEQPLDSTRALRYHRAILHVSQ